MRRTLILAAAAAASATLVGSTTAIFSDPLKAAPDSLARSRLVRTATPHQTTPHPARAASAAAAAVPKVAGLAGLCVDDAGGKAMARGKVQLWNCHNGPAQGWVSAGGELKHDGMCANDSDWGGDHSRVIMWACTGAANERWAYRGGSYVLAAGGGRLCLDDPASSVKRGVQLIVYRCHGGANQRWSQPTVSR